ncbi:septum formation inhibitor Maf [Aliidiomarina minuta]|uniref:dTTP/UTP pyrophosphatase n=1 Tax=Aliidiomarina minuta TaxID=880057 RepID=A0A432WAQ2_9GAMM|nr:Maf family protein [Aliidiomarina minuta]RUO26668.1 septum formation inhibitor Maf [Aliidiomarina minuta]
MKNLYLASASPRRYELLGMLEHPFERVNAEIEELQQEHEAPHQYVVRLAIEKAQAGLQQVSDPQAKVLGADTIVVVAGKVLEKPRNKDHFRQMFDQLSGSTHQVMTAICVATEGKELHDLVTTEVTFCHLTEAEVEHYWSTGEPLDKAGGYGIQGRAGKFVQQLRGSYFAVVGLPLYETNQLLQRIEQD